MKVNFYLLILSASIMFAGCSSHQNYEISNECVRSFEKNRTVQDAVIIAQQAVASMSSVTKSDVVVDEKNVSVICRADSRSSDSDTLLYVVNNMEGNGFTLVSAPNNVEPIIAIVDNGSFNSAETQTNDGFLYALETAKVFVETASGKTYGSDMKTSKILPCGRLVSEFGVPRVKTQWSQSWPENIYCPNKIAGCVPVAIGQICSYFSEPTQIALSFAEQDKSSIDIDWNSLIKHKNSNNVTSSDTTVHYQSCSVDEETHKTIGRFIRQIGVIAECLYKEKSTGAAEEDAYYALQALTYNRTHKYTDDAEALYKLLGSNGVALAIGYDKSNGGHAWVVDATGEYGSIEYVYERSSEGGELQLVDEISSTQHYLHFNWGWGGNCNGFFLAGVFNTKNSYKQDTETNTANFDFSYYTNFLYTK
jgi:hypothetical protein